MSGICGIVNFDGAPVEPEVLEQMAQAAGHRGPDGISHWIDGNVGLSHLALNFTPESLRERQPLASQEGDLILTADARVDNRDELISSLKAKGQLTNPDPTDADLILAAYRCWGADCPTHLIGDFAFAIWDAALQRLFAARDPMAMRAFYYRAEPQRLIFATELKQILAVPNVPSHIFEPMVAAHLTGLFGPLAQTLYEGIAQLEPAHALLVDKAGRRTWRYWDIDPHYQVRYANEDEYAEHFLEIFREAVRCRLRSVKPVGIFLSGGMDSGSIASTAGWLLKKDGQGNYPPFHAYCFALENLIQCDERHISDGIVHHYGFPVTNLYVEQNWPLKDYPAHGPDRDEPFVGVYQAQIEHGLATAQGEGMGLMLSGDRGDLMTGGWNLNYLSMLRSGQWLALWDELRIHSRSTNEPLYLVMGMYLLKPLLAFLQRSSSSDWLGWPGRQIRGMLHSSKPPRWPYPDWVRPEFVRGTRLAEFCQQIEPKSKVNGFARRQRYKLIFTLMHMRGVVWSERSQARFGLGFADPWSDRRIASFVLAAPQQVLNRPGEVNKRLTRQAMRGIMPEEVRRTARKISPYPLYMWALKKQARDTVLDLITNSQSSARGYIDEISLQKHYEAICHGEPEHPYFWWALTLEMWLRQYWPVYS